MLSVRRSLQSFLGRGLGIVAMLTVFLVWWKFQGDPGPLQSTHQVQGEIVEVRERAYRVRLESGAEVMVSRTVNLDQGRQVTLRVETYASGEAVHSLMDPTVQ